MDLVGPLPTTSRGHKYVMTLTDYYNKWAEAYPICDKTASSVAGVLYSVSSGLLKNISGVTVNAEKTHAVNVNKSITCICLFICMQVMCRLGYPSIIISDQGREFVNELSRSLFSKTKTEHNYQRIPSTGTSQSTCKVLYVGLYTLTERF